MTPSQSGLDGVDQWSQLQDPTLAGPRLEMLYNIAYNQRDQDDLEPFAAIRKEHSSNIMAQ